MRALRATLTAVAALAVAGSARAQEAPAPPHQHWSFNGPLGGYDLASLQRGFQVYSEVCASCHSMRQLSYRDLSGIGLNAQQIKAVAASVQVPLGVNDQGEPVIGPGTPSSRFRSPFANDTAARAANNGALPPDLSLIVKAREYGADYVYGILTGYGDAPDGFEVQPGMMYNRYFPGHQIAMPQPLQEDQVTYADGTKATIEQEAEDVTAFLTWAANPELVARKQMGVRWVLFLSGMTVLAFLVKRRVWAERH